MQSVRAAGLDIGRLPPGPKNSICDVPGVRVGHVTLIADEPDVVRSGVTVILPPAQFPEQRLPAASVVFNGTGEFTGLYQVNEWGFLESPIALTGTAGVAQAMLGLQQYLLEQSARVGRTQAPPLPVVGECNDMWLSDSRACPLRPQHVLEAIAGSSTDEQRWGACGAGTGMVSFGFKGGIGSASRVVEAAGRSYTLGAVCLVNFGQPGDLIVGGRPLGHLPGEIVRRRPRAVLPDGSLITVLITDAPLDYLLLRRLASRAGLGMARVGSHGRHGSGDIFLAVSTAYSEWAHEDAETRKMEVLRGDAANPLFHATVEATEEAILQSLFCATAMTGFAGHSLEALPVDEVIRRTRGA